MPRSSGDRPHLALIRFAGGRDPRRSLALLWISAWLACGSLVPAWGAFRQDVEADWLRQDALRLGAAPGGEARPSTSEDATGAVDGVKNGRWGFHTAQQEGPWWEVDLGRVVRLDRVVIFNRTEFAERSSKIMVLVRDDANDSVYRQIYQHTGRAFFGVHDRQPLAVDLGGVKARHLRLAVPGNTYFHLDEVEVFAEGSSTNVALGKPANQSSTSQWSVRHAADPPDPARSYPMGTVLRRGRELAGTLRRDGVNVDEQLRAMANAEANWTRLGPDAADAQRRALYFEARWAVRRLALLNPKLDFAQILFVKRAPGILPHMSDQHYGWWSRPGGGIYVLDRFRTTEPRVRCLTTAFPAGSFIGPDVSYDGQRVLFAYCRYYPQVAAMEKVDKEKLPEHSFYKVYEMNLDGSGTRQLTFGRYDDFDPRYLPSGDLMFLSTRKGTALQCSREASERTRAATLPDSYVRCGGDNVRPCAVFTLHAMDRNGDNLRPLSAFENFEWTPSVAADGRLLYARWDYIDRFNGHFESLWSANQDGTNPQLVYGNYTIAPQAVFEARSIPGSAKLVFTASAHHSITGGSLCLLDRERGLEGQAPLTRITPEVLFPETEGPADHYYANPWPLSEEFFLCGWADQKLPPHAGSQTVTDARNPANAMGIYLYDVHGNLELLHRDPAISSMYPMPAAARPRPAPQASLVDWNAAPEGRVLLQDVYAGLGNTPRGSITRLRIVGVLPKVQPHMNTPELGVSAEDPGKFVLGTVPVEVDGSAYLRVPSGIPVFFQALDTNGLALQTMRTLTYVQPGHTLSCIGCHESRDLAPAVNRPPLAMHREPSRLQAGPDGSWPLRFDRLVQPILDAQCVRCHRPGSDDIEAARLDLTPEHAWRSLLTFGGEDLKTQAFERDQSVPGAGTCANSKLWKLLTHGAGHKEVQLDQSSRERFATWMDTYAHQVGHFSRRQEDELIILRQALLGSDL